MIRRFSCVFWLVIGFLSCGCSTSTSHLTATPDPAAPWALIVEITGSVQRQRPGWVRPMPLTIGARLDRDDLLLIGANSSVQLVCDDLSKPPALGPNDGAINCQQSSQPMMQRANSSIAAPLRTTAAAQIPIVEQPRHTLIDTPQPLITWAETAPKDTIVYTVRISDTLTNTYWETTTSDTSVRFTAPPTFTLRTNRLYQVVVVDSAGRSSEAEPQADRGFQVVAPPIKQALHQQIARIKGLQLTPVGDDIVSAEIYAANQLRVDALDRLAHAAKQMTAPHPNLDLRRGDLYMAMGLFSRAYEAYMAAEQAYQAIGDLSGVGRARMQIAVTFERTGDRATARESLLAAQHVYEQLNDSAGTASVLQKLTQIGGQP